MAYIFYLDGEQLPITPGELQVKINNYNETVTLMNDGEINVLKLPGLTDIEFEIRLPQLEYPFEGSEFDSYPFASYPNGFRTAEYYLDKLETLKTERQPFQFIVSRALPGYTTNVNFGEEGKKAFSIHENSLFGTNIKVTVEDYTINEDAKEGFDVIVKINLKQYRNYGTKIYTREEGGAPGEVAVTVEEARETDNAPANNTHTVAAGDTLYNIAKQYLGDGGRYPEIFDLNKDKITNPNVISVGQVLTLPQK